MTNHDLHELRQTVRGRFWVEAALAVASAVLLVLTMIWHDWIEIVLGVRLDHGDGSLERLLVIVFLLVTAASSALTRHEWRRNRLARPHIGHS